MEIGNYASIEKAKKYSEDIVGKLIIKFKNIRNKDYCIVTTGSFARGEASDASDLDCFIISKNDVTVNEFQYTKEGIVLKDDFKKFMETTVYEYIKKDSGDTGTFGFDAVVKINDLTTNIGGTEDSNTQLTRRMLFLLEGKCLYNDALFEEFRKQVLEEYIKESVSDHQLSRFFLNDIIRYYRTITTDFEHKVSEKGKDWGVRNIKLTFSRKLLYFAGILTVAETAQKTRDTKIKETLKLLDMSPLERIKYIAGYRVDKVFESYNYFLEHISQNEIREELEKAKVDVSAQKNPDIFREMKNESKHFSWALSSVLEQTYDSRHPIHHALIF